MKNCTNWSLALMAGVILALSSGFSRADAVQDGLAAFDKGDYAAAARAFDTALSAGPKSAGLYYDLAVAQIKAGDRPKAALNLHRAIALDPRMMAARAALSELERAQGITVPPVVWRTWIDEHIPVPALLVTGGVIGWAGGFILLYGIFKRGRKFAALAAAIVIIAVGKITFGAGYFSDPRVFDRHTGVAMDDVSLLSAPTDQSPEVGKLPACAPITILQESGEWTYCRSSTGEKGWAPSAKIEAMAPSA